MKRASPPQVPAHPQPLTGLSVGHRQLGEQQGCGDPFGDCGDLSALGGCLLYCLHKQGQKVQGLPQCVTCGEKHLRDILVCRGDIIT